MKQNNSSLHTVQRAPFPCTHFKYQRRVPISFFFMALHPTELPPPELPPSEPSPPEPPPYSDQKVSHHSSFDGRTATRIITAPTTATFAFATIVSSAIITVFQECNLFLRQTIKRRIAIRLATAPSAAAFAVATIASSALIPNSGSAIEFTISSSAVIPKSGSACNLLCDAPSRHLLSRLCQPSCYSSPTICISPYCCCIRICDSIFRCNSESGSAIYFAIRLLDICYPSFDSRIAIHSATVSYAAPFAFAIAPSAVIFALHQYLLQLLPGLFRSESASSHFLSAISRLRDCHDDVSSLDCFLIHSLIHGSRESKGTRRERD